MRNARPAICRADRGGATAQSRGQFHDWHAVELGALRERTQPVREPHSGRPCSLGKISAAAPTLKVNLVKGYVSFLRAGGYMVAAIDLIYKHPPRFAVKLPEPP